MGAFAILSAASTSGAARTPDPAAPRTSPSSSPSAIDAVRSAATAAAARDWLETQARVVEYWRDLLADAGATDELIEAMEVHAAFLNGVAARS